MRGLWCMVRGAWSIVPRKPMPENDRRTQLFSIINKKSQRLDGRSQNRRAALGRRRSWNRFAALGRGRPRPKAGYHSRTPRVAPKKRINTGKTGGSRKIPSRPSVDGRSRNRLAALGRRRSRNRFAALGRGRPQPKAGYHSRIPRGAKIEKRRGREARARYLQGLWSTVARGITSRLSGDAALESLRGSRAGPPSAEGWISQQDPKGGEKKRKIPERTGGLTKDTFKAFGRRSLAESRDTQAKGDRCPATTHSGGGCSLSSDEALGRRLDIPVGPQRGRKKKKRAGGQRGPLL